MVNSIAHGKFTNHLLFSALDGSILWPILCSDASIYVDRTAVMCIWLTFTVRPHHAGEIPDCLLSVVAHPVHERFP